MTFALIPYRELVTARLGELGRAYLAVRDGERVAIAGTYDLLYWCGRAIYDGHEPRQRVALYAREPRGEQVPSGYDQPSMNRLAVFDDAWFPINDLAFHPREPVIALATGSYDGGYAFEGAVLLWNWQSGEVRSVLAESRQAARCRFEPDGRLVLLVKPPTDEEDPRAVFGLVLDDLRATPSDPKGDPRLRDLHPCTPEAFGFTAPSDTLAALGLESRAKIWDLAWLADGRLVAAYADGRVELWRPTGELIASLRAPGSAVQILERPDEILVNVVDGKNCSTLYAVSDSALVPWRVFTTGRTCSVDATGRVLARNTTSPAPSGRADVIAGDRGETLFEAELGHYDSFNHFVRIDGAPDLYYLRGTPQTQHQAKRLCRIDANHAIDDSIAWDGESAHLMGGSAVLVDGDLVRSYRVYERRGRGRISVERCATRDGRVIWRHDVPALATSLVAWPAAASVVFALVDGTVGVLDAATGSVWHEERFAIDGVPTIVTALAIFDQMIALATIDGRISIFALR